MFALKIPIVALGCIVWWAMHQTPETDDEPGRRRRDQGPPHPRVALPAPAAPRPARRPARAASPRAARRARALTAPRPRALGGIAFGACPRPPPSCPTARSAASSTRAASRSTRGTRTSSSRRRVDLRLGDSFRVFHNHRASAIDLRDPPTNLTEEVVTAADEPFVIHPGEFASGARSSGSSCPTTSSRASRGSRAARAPRPDRPRDRGLRRPGLEGHAHARVHQPDARADQALRRACRSPSSRSWRSTRRRERPYGSPSLGSHYQGQTAATESRYGRGGAIGSPPCLQRS